MSDPIAYLAVVEAKKAIYNHLVKQCNGQSNRSFPIRPPDQTDEEYEPKLKAWLYEKARLVFASSSCQACACRHSLCTAFLRTYLHAEKRLCRILIPEQLALTL